MTAIADLHLGLPSDIEAEIGDIESGADDLDQLRQTMLGDAETTDTQFRTASGSSPTSSPGTSSQLPPPN
ncbi:hypothetical protein KGD82_21930 [Nocardiopsis eucommiae]|uniref:Uncharacterized protein n=1 Tax=Nocardiopsis eucommiae TaxID=2831970 RepID=A0A975QIP9_9ACTN|nr:hypothetical protein KGD82_21930 [Nocardiopsis eucommiae]